MSCQEGSACVVCDGGEEGDDITQEEWKQIEMDFGWTKADFDQPEEGMSPQGIEGQTYEMPEIYDDLSVEAEAARIHSNLLGGDWDFAAALAEYEEKTAPFRPEPKKAWMYLSQAWTGSSTGAGWRAYSRKGDASRYGGKEPEKKVTLFDDGTWSYGIHD